MINNIQYTNIRVILDSCLQNGLLQDLTLEQIVGYTIRFNGILNIPQLYQSKQSCIDIKDYRGFLPCDLVSVIQVKDEKTQSCIPEISGTFLKPRSMERAFMTKRNVIFTTFKEGRVEVSYRAIPVDEEGYPLILDNEKYKNALELFIKKDKFTKYFEQNKISLNVLQNTQLEYSKAVGQLSNELKMPSLSQWENISNAHNQLLDKPGEFKKGFETTGITELYKIH